MVIYSAKSNDIAAAPVPAKAAPKKRKQKQIEQEPSPEPSEPEPVAAPTPVEEQKPKEKKPRTEKQIAAAEKMRAAREAKKEAAKKEEEELELKAQAIQKEIEEKEALLAQKKEERKEKRRLARESKQAAPSQEPQPVQPAGQEPPEYLTKLISSVLHEQAKLHSPPTPKAEVREQVRHVAQSRWNDGITRDRIQSQVDSHMSKMYSAMFGRKF